MNDGRVRAAVIGDGLAAAAIAARLAQDPRFELTVDRPELLVGVGPALIPAVNAMAVRLGTPDRTPGPAWVDARGKPRRVIDELARTAKAGPTAPERMSRLVGTLTEREEIVLSLVASGLDREAIAVRLGTSPHTVRTHLQNLRGKLGARSQHELVAIGHERWATGAVDNQAPTDVPAAWVPPLPDVLAGPRTVVAGSWPLRLEGLALVCATSGLHVVACASSEAGVLTAVVEHGAEVVLMAGQLTGTTAGRLVARAKAAADVRVVVLSDLPDDEELVAAIEAGADGYLGPEAGPDELLAALDAAAAGEPAVPRSMLGPLLRTLVERRRAEREVLLRYADLSVREREIVGYLADGMDHLAIAQKLVVSPHTARSHIQNTLRKLGAHSRAEAAAIARRFDLPRP